METRLNKSGNRRGIHNYTKGSKHHSSKGWILFKDSAEVGFFATLREAAEFTGVHTYAYLCQLAKERHINKTSGQPRTVTSYGWSIKPATALKFSNNNNPNQELQSPSNVI